MFPEMKIDAFVREKMGGTEEAAHAYDHVRRVFDLSMALGSKVGADLRVLGAAALLHDIGRPQEDATGISHSILSGEMSRDILQECGYSDSEIEQVVQAIRTHRFSEGIVPTSIEGKVLCDADKLDAMGAIGVYRAIARAATTGVGVMGFLRHSEEKLLKLKNLMHTDAARALAEERHDILAVFVEQLKQELA